MALIGNKQCASCNSNMSPLAVLKVSLGKSEFPCKSCGEPFQFSYTRKWIAIIAVLCIIFAPTSGSVFEGVPYMTEGTIIVFRYIVALFLFILINGRASS